MICKGINMENLLNACRTLKITYESDNFDEGQKEFALESDIEYIIQELNKLEKELGE